MDLHKFIEEKGEGLKKIGAIFWILNSIETEIITQITFFFTDWSGKYQWKSIVFNRSLFNEKIFPSLENKRRFFLKIVESLDEIAKWKHIEFEKEKWIEIGQVLNKIQKIRNKLAHNFIRFSEDNERAIFNDTQILTGPYLQKEINLDDTLEMANSLSIKLRQLLPDFVYQAQIVLNAPDPKIK